MSFLRRFGGLGIAALAALGGGCRFDLAQAPRPGGDGGADAVVCPDTGVPGSKRIGERCLCGSECASALCADGTCCKTACTAPCFACNVAGSKGTCTLVPAGLASRAGECAREDAALCAHDGTCDGRGGCGLYPTGSPCAPGRCEGPAVVAARACDGKGACIPAIVVTCAPYACNAAAAPPACQPGCTTAAECAPGRSCDKGSCGKKFDGAVCGTDGECASGACADGVCCHTPCAGACVSCNRVGAIGTCTPAPRGHPDPHGQCREQEPCGQTGVCDGAGACARYAPGTGCAPALCSGTSLMVGGTCDTSGRCQIGGTIDCAPFGCRAGACIGKCASDADCAPGRPCVDGSCGPRGLGQACAAASECASGFCVDGVCCAEACAGACRTCAGSAMPGQCVKVAAGVADPRLQCADKGPASCGTDGTCDGIGGCRKYPIGTTCVPRSCKDAVVTGAGTCDAAGACVPGAERACTPFQCNGDDCFSSCGGDADCVPPAKCTGASCGKKSNGASCADGSECVSGICAQGVCCGTACGGACRSCALPGSGGTCTTVPAGGADPAKTCIDAGVAGCGTDGTCDGTGKCRKYAPGTICKPAACPPGSTLTTESICDGAGKCGGGTTQSCAPYVCDGAAACRTTCGVPADCVAPATCVSGSCGKRGNGSPCSIPAECLSGFCEQGTCCGTACAGGCRSCALAGSQGTCLAIAAGAAALTGFCTDQGPASCGLDGKCDGSGGCRKYPAGTVCIGASCPAGTHVRNLARTCDGSGVCLAGMTQDCSPYLCDGATACRVSCTVPGDCVAPSTCTAGSCGKKANGAGCSAPVECQSGFCEQGVCCGTACVGTCRSCALPSFAGTCRNVPSGAEPPPGQCDPEDPSTCGRNGLCNGTGGCQLWPSGTLCMPGSCPVGTSTFTADAVCNGAGMCSAAAVSSCVPYLCDGAHCRSTCAGSGDCAPPNTCTGSACGALLPPGSSCTASGQCTTGMCVDSVCCNVSSCGRCKRCGTGGNCALVPAGSLDPSGTCMDAPPCGTDGRCDAAGNCSKYPVGATCAADTCNSTNKRVKRFTCDATGACVNSATIDCCPYACSAGACLAFPCGSNADCRCSSACLPDNTCGNPCPSCTPFACDGMGGCYMTCTDDSQCCCGLTCLGGSCVEPPMCMPPFPPSCL